MRVLVTGASGLVGSALVSRLAAAGHDVKRAVRSSPKSAAEVQWDPVGGTIDEAGLLGTDAVVHLAGENVAGGRWTAAMKARIRDSRVDGTRTLSEALARMAAPPKTLVSASAVGYYGDRGDELLDETSAPGQSFLAQVCREWEAATEPAERAGVRVVRLRIGAVLSADGGALAKTLPIFRLGLGGRVGPGTQYISWISLDDVVAAVSHALGDGALRGAVNAVAPEPVTDAEVTAALGRALSRPTPVPAPAFALRLALGEMADEVLLSSARVVPARLRESGFAFRHPEIDGALRHALGK